MRQRYADLQAKATALVNGQNFIHTGSAQSIAPANFESLKRVRDNRLDNDPALAIQRRTQQCGFCSRRSGA